MLAISIKINVWHFLLGRILPRHFLLSPELQTRELQEMHLVNSGGWFDGANL